jgi:hypothetical protein
MEPKDLVKPAIGVLGLTAIGALGFAAGFVVARDPELLRKLARSVAGGVDNVTRALAESREQVADVWAEVRDDVRRAGEAQAFAAAAAASAAPAAAAGAAKRRARRTSAPRRRKKPEPSA